MKLCNKCGENKVLSEYYKNSTNKKDGLSASCKQCVAVRSSQWNRDNKTRRRPTMRRSHVKRKYNLSWEEYQAMWEEQNGCCAICELPFSDALPAAVDHDHGCCPGLYSCGKCVRGLLCRPCNIFIAHAKENATILRNGVRYLRTRKLAA